MYLGDRDLHVELGRKVRPKKNGLIGVIRPTLVTLPTLDIYINFSKQNKEKKMKKRLRKKEKEKKDGFFFHFLSLFTSKTSD